MKKIMEHKANEEWFFVRKLAGAFPELVFTICMLAGAFPEIDGGIRELADGFLMMNKPR